MTVLISDHELSEKLKAGDNDGFLILYELYGKSILNLAYKMTGSFEEAEDITQNTFVQAYLNIHGFEGRSKLYTWLYAIAKNLCLRYLADRKSSIASLQLLIETVQAPETADQYSDIEKKFYIEQVKEGCLLGLLRCLSFHQRMAFILYVLLEVELKNVAAILNKSESATRTLIHRAKRNVKDFICRNCSRYNESNPCRCEDLIEFSLKQGWIKASEGIQGAGYRKEIPPSSIEAEIQGMSKIVQMYHGLPTKEPSDNLIRHIRNYITESGLEIFHYKKVK